jgi:hypothetical protein
MLGVVHAELYKAANILSNFTLSFTHTMLLCPACCVLQAIRLEPERGLPTSLLAGARGLALLSVVRLGAGWSCTAGTGRATSCDLQDMDRLE